MTQKEKNGTLIAKITMCSLFPMISIKKITSPYNMKKNIK